MQPLPAPNPAHWRTLNDAPDIGTKLTPLDGIPDGDAREFRFGRRGSFSMFVVRRGAEVHAYVNVCPHFGTPLNDRGATFLTDDAARIRCTKHFSEYRLEDGFGVAGHGEGCWLDRVPVVVEDGVVTIR